MLILFCSGTWSIKGNNLPLLIHQGKNPMLQTKSRKNSSLTLKLPVRRLQSWWRSLSTSKWESIYQFTSTYPTLLNTGSRGKSVHLKDSCDKAGGIISIHFDIMMVIKRLNRLPLFLSPDLIHCLECWCPLLILPDGNPRIVKAVAGGGGAHLGGGALETHLGQVSQGKLRDLCTFENLWSLLCPPSMICANYHLPLTLENAGLPWGERYLQVRFAT